MASTARFRKWMMETVYSELKVEVSYNCAIWCSATTYQKINSSIVSDGAMNRFKEMFPIARMFPLPVMHSVFCEFSGAYYTDKAYVINAKYFW